MVALLIAVLVVVSYTFAGGFFAVCWTDLVQGLLMFMAIVIVTVSTVESMGGLSATLDNINSVNPQLLNAFTTSDGSRVALISVVSSLAWGLGYFGQPHILVRFMGIKDAEEIKHSIRIAMVWEIFLIASAAIIASNPNNTVLDLVENAWAGFGATFGPIVIFSLFWKRITKKGAIAGMVTGGVSVIIWRRMGVALGGIFTLYEIVPGFLLSALVIYIVSKMDKEPSQDIIDEFEKV